MKKIVIKNLYQQISALVWKEDSLYVAKALEIEIASQGRNKKEALNNLKEAIELYFEKELTSPKLTPLKDLSLEKLNFNYA